MHTQYSDQDTEQVRAAEQHSATLYAHGSARPRNDRNTTIALGLLALGAFMLVGRVSDGLFGGGLSSLAEVTPDFRAGVFFLTVASGFLFFGLWKHIYGLIIPGCIIAGFALGVTFSDLLGSATFFWGLASGFLALYAVGRGLFQMHSPWPLIPGIILTALGTIAAASVLPGIFSGALLLLPLGLIGAGLYLGWMRRAA